MILIICLLSLSLSSCLTKKILVSDFCESYQGFPDENFSQDILNYTDKLSLSIDKKSSSGAALTAEEKVYELFLNYAIYNEKVAEKKQCNF